MFLGALVGAGANLAVMRQAVQDATGGRGDLSQESVSRGGIQGIKVTVVLDGTPLIEDPGHGGESHGTSWSAIDKGLAESPLEPQVKSRAREVFKLLAEAEGRVHGMPLSKVHFHELGGLDAVADIVGTVSGLADLGLDHLYHGPVNAGGGVVKTAHGELPVPAPATLDLLQGRLINLQRDGGELLTPTGAALLVTFAQPLEASLTFVPGTVGMGAGTRDTKARPNLARLVIGVPDVHDHKETVGVVETSLDDCSPEDIGFWIEQFLEAGAYDVTVTPLLMKKGRPGFLLRLLVPAEEVEDWALRVTEQTSSLGARWRIDARHCLERRIDTLDLPQGSFRVKVAILASQDERPHVEFEDLRRASQQTGTPMGELRRLVERAWEQRQ